MLRIMAGKRTKGVASTIRMPEDLWRAVKHAAIEQRRPLAEVVAEALRDYLKRQPRPKP